MVSVPVAVYSLQMTTFIHQSQLRSTLGIPRSTSFQCYLSLLLPPLLFFFATDFSFYCKYPSRLSAPFRVRVALQQGRFYSNSGMLRGQCVKTQRLRTLLVVAVQTQKSADGSLHLRTSPLGASKSACQRFHAGVCLFFFKP